MAIRLAQQRREALALRQLWVMRMLVVEVDCLTP